MPFCDSEEIAVLPKIEELEETSLLPELQAIGEPQTIGQHLRKRRIQLRMKQIEVARQFGVSEDTITYWENERTVPQIQFYPKIIAFLGYNPSSTKRETIGQRILSYRTERGLSYKKLASLTAFDAGSLARWEENKSQPSKKAKQRLLALGIIQ